MIDPQYIKRQTALLLKEELSEAELSRFLAEIETNEDVSNIVMEEIARHSGRIALKQKLQEIHLEFDNQSKVNYWPWLSVAASIILICVSIFYWQSTRPQDLYDTYYEAYRSPMLARGLDTSRTAKLWEDAVLAYRDGNYAESILILEDITTQSTNPEYQFYLGISYLAISPPDIEKAIPVLEKVYTLKSEFHEQTTWYLALAYWKNQQKEAARELFNLIAERSNSYRQEEAKEILALWNDK